jgi:3-hydroxyacyl-CoA dehydrogenase
MEAEKLGIFDLLLESGAVLDHDAFHDQLAMFALSDHVQSTPLSGRQLSARAVPGTTTDAGGVLVVDKEQWAHIHEVTTTNARGHIAPLAILKCVQAAVAAPSFRDGVSMEEQVLQVLMKGPQAKALQYLFLSEKRCSNVPKDADLRSQHVTLPEQAEGKFVAVDEVKTAGVVGGGTMGTGIAMSIINAGIPVVLVETSMELATAALLRIERVYKASSAYTTGRMSKAELQSRLDLVTVSSDFGRLADADLVIEAVYENLKLKQDVFAQLDKVCKPSAILATNTSYLDVDQIAGVTSRPHNVVGTRE